jgi:hypothetical protein
MRFFFFPSDAVAKNRLATKQPLNREFPRLKAGLVTKGGNIPG